MPHSVLHNLRLRCLTGLLFATSVLSACTYEHSRQKTASFLRDAELVTHHQISRSGEWVLSSASVVCLVNPYQVGQRSAPRAHVQLTQALSNALGEHFVVIPVTDPSSDLHAAVRLSGALGCNAMLMPQILRADDQLNSWVEIDRDRGVWPDRRAGADRLVVRVSMYDVVHARPLDIATVRSATGWWTIHPRSPANLFEQAMREYAQRITGRPRAG